MFYLVELGDLRGLPHCKCWCDFHGWLWGEVSLGVLGEEGTVIPNSLDTSHSWVSSGADGASSNHSLLKNPFNLEWFIPANALNIN